MTTTNDGGAAFPGEVSNGLVRVPTRGMSLRDYFAAKAMAALISHRDLRDSVEEIKVASEAYSYADAMIKARGGQ